MKKVMHSECVVKAGQNKFPDLFYPFFGLIYFFPPKIFKLSSKLSICEALSNILIFCFKCRCSWKVFLWSDRVFRRFRRYSGMYSVGFLLNNNCRVAVLREGKDKRLLIMLDPKVLLYWLNTICNYYLICKSGFGCKN